MRISQLQSLNSLELALIIYIVNEIEPIQSPKTVIMDKKDLLWVNHDALLAKLTRQESKLTEEGKTIFKNIMFKLNKTSIQEIEENEVYQKLLETENLKQMEFTYEYTKSSELSQSNFEF